MHQPQEGERERQKTNKQDGLLQDVKLISPNLGPMTSYFIMLSGLICHVVTLKIKVS
jgi:hypothetical protein